MSIPPLTASYYTLAGIRPLDGPHRPSPIDLRDRIEAASAAGFRGIGTDVTDLLASVERYGCEGIRAMLADNELVHFEIEGMGDWYARDSRRYSNEAHRATLTAAEKIGAAQIKITGNIFGRGVPVETMRAEFATLAREAAGAGVRLALEIVCISDIPDVATALEVVGDTAPRDGGVMIDIWHFVRGGQPFESIRALSGGTLAWVEIDDGAAVPAGSIVSEQLDDRRLPGDGAFDIAAYLAEVRATGYTGGIGVEILSEELRALSVREAAQRTFQKAVSQFA